jgi:hypothetical protein
MLTGHSEVCSAVGKGSSADVQLLQLVQWTSTELLAVIVMMVPVSCLFAITCSCTFPGPAFTWQGHGLTAVLSDLNLAPCSYPQ